MNKSTREYLDFMLKDFGAKISTKDSLVQSKAENYVGYYFKDCKKIVKDFQIVSIKTGMSYANVNSDIYLKIPKEILNIVLNSYFETSKTIYC